MCCLNAKENAWQKKIILLNCGVETKLIAADKEIRQEIGRMIEIVIRVMACMQFSDGLNVTTDLKEVGIKVKHTSKFLTKWLKSGKNILTV